MNKKVILFISIISLIVLSIVLIAYFQKEKNNPNEEYVPGEIIIGFNEDVTESEANLLIEKYNLEWEESFFSESGPNHGIIKVPTGKEQEWIATFQKEDIVKYAELNGYVYALD